METVNKRFNEWMKVKSDAHFKAPFHSIKEGEVWWAEIGENVGVEINGKKRIVHTSSTYS